MRIHSRIWYYATSVFTLLSGFSQPVRMVAIFLGWPNALPMEVQLRQSGWRFKIRTAMDVWIIKETCLDQDYLSVLKALESTWTVVDIGAGLGDFTVYAAKHCFDGNVYAYEPLAESFALLEVNLALNKVTNAHPFPSAVAAQEGVLTLDEAGAEAVSARFVDSPGETRVPAVSLAKVLDSLPEGRCDFMKIDCEGCEFDLLLNSPKELLSRIDRISLEFHEDATSHHSDDLVTCLERQGFKVIKRSNPAHSYLGFLYASRTGS